MRNTNLAVLAIYKVTMLYLFTQERQTMATNRLNDDLLQNFKQQKELITEQIKIFEPIAESLSRPAAVHLLGQGTLIILEIVCYALFLGVGAFAFVLNRIPPFNVLKQMSNHPGFVIEAGVQNVLYFNFAFYGLIALIALLFLIVGINISSIRRKNKILDVAGKNLKTLVGQHLRCKASIDTIEQRHFMELPVVQVSHRVNEVPNPGYGE